MALMQQPSLEKAAASIRQEGATIGEDKTEG